MNRSQTNTITFTFPSPRPIHSEEIELLLTQEACVTLILDMQDRKPTKSDCQ